MWGSDILKEFSENIVDGMINCNFYRCFLRKFSATNLEKAPKNSSQNAQNTYHEWHYLNFGDYGHFWVIIFVALFLHY